MPANNVKGRKKNERRNIEIKQMTGTGSTRCLKRSTGLMDPTQTSGYHGWRKYSPWPTPRNARNELIYNSGGSVQKTLYSLPSDALVDKIHDLLLHNHSNLKTSSQHTSAFDSLQQKPEELLQTYNANTSPTMSWHTKASQS